MNREVESASMRPLAKALTKQLDLLRSLLRDQCLRNQYTYSEKISEALVLFDKMFAKFELSYVSAMVPVKTVWDYEKLQEVTVLFCETVQRALKLGLLTQDMMDDYDPALMFTIPRLAIVCGLFVYPEGPINPDMEPINMCEMFRPFHMLLYKIRIDENSTFYPDAKLLTVMTHVVIFAGELLWTLSDVELSLLEKALSHCEEDSFMLTNISFEEQRRRLNWFQLESERGEHTSTAADESGTPGDGGAENRNHGDNSCVENDNRSSEDSISNYGNSDVEATSNHGDDVGGRVDEGGIDSCDNGDEKGSSHGNGDGDIRSHSDSKVEVSNCDRTEFSVADHENGDWNSVNRSNSDIDEPDEGSQIDRSLSVPHQDSGDSGMISMSDHVSAASANVTEDATCHVPRLHWSRSWPPRSASSAGQLQSHRHSVCGDSPKYIRNTEPLQNDDTDSSAQRIGQFVFHLPFNTSSNDSTVGSGVVERQVSKTRDGSPSHGDTQEDKVDDSCSSIDESDSAESQRDNVEATCRNNSQIIYTLNGRETQLVEGRHLQHPPDGSTSSSQIAFITGALNQFFFTDPEFEGVTPPRTPSTSSGSSMSCGRVEQTSKCDESRPVSHGLCLSCNSDVRQENNSRHRSDSARFKHHLTNRRSKVCMCAGVNRSNQHQDNGSSVSSINCDCDKESHTNSDTSSYTSDGNDDEEIALAIHAAEIAARREARARFRDSGELIHKLFVCISGVADQLQTNQACDLRHILKAVFQCYSTAVDDEMHSVHEKCSQNSEISRTSQGLHGADTDSDSNHSNVDSDSNHNISIGDQQSTDDGNTESDAGLFVVNPDFPPPHWVPDDQSPCCTSCKVPFTFVRRRHHCRNCGKIFCSRCSSNSVPLPHFGHDKPVRVCNHCFIYQVTPFTVGD
ncbi:hypothetical protein LSH36_452g01014 [Paralvinella palmiformis]|uniref:FYVE-type domain-containing protein n=1 Tax=Paralvinella palmiformis TaxID=53620 RepID=A0AAD9JAE5_9ANNE|nr:hypothetical protein LSH36_452g01014 [Paralvinella palmiformis]